MFSSIRVRLIFSHLAVIILAMGLSGGLLLSSLQQYFLRATEDSLIAQARITAQALIPGALAEGPLVENQAALSNTIQQQASNNLSIQSENLLLPSDELESGEMDLTYLTDASLQLGAQLNTRIRILDSQGWVLVDSRKAQSNVDLHADPLVAQALAGQYASRNGRENESDWMYLAMPALVDDRLVGVIYLSQPLDNVTTVLGDLRQRWVLSTTVAMLLSGVAGLFLSQAITSPIRRLTAVASAVARGQLDLQVQVRSQDELGRLSRTFNDMIARLQAARQMQLDFVANVSHELRTPLTTVKGMLETLRDGAVDDPSVRDRFLETVDKETNRLIRLVNDLLLLSQVDSEALNLQRQTIDLVALVQDTVKRLSPGAEERELALKVEASSGALMVWADPDRIDQVLVNLLDNALKYSRPGGTVTVGVEVDSGGTARVQVRDEGIGISPADLPHIGTRFYRADKGRSRTHGGSGLGLAIARAYVQANGGKLWLESREGDGTLVSFTLPRP